MRIRTAGVVAAALALTLSVAACGDDEPPRRTPPTFRQSWAQLDECAYVATFLRIIVPLARPGLAVTAFSTFLAAWGEVAYASAFIQTDRNFTLAYGLERRDDQLNGTIVGT